MLNQRMQGIVQNLAAAYHDFLPCKVQGLGFPNLSKLKHDACTISPIARTFFMLKRKFKSHVETIDSVFPIHSTTLDKQCEATPRIQRSHKIFKRNQHNTSTNSTCIASLPSHKYKIPTKWTSSRQKIQVTIQTCPERIRKALQLSPHANHVPPPRHQTPTTNTNLDNHKTCL